MSRDDRIAAVFLHRYYTHLISDWQSLLPWYVAQPTVAHGDETNIASALHRYGSDYGVRRIVLSEIRPSRNSTAGRLHLVVEGTMVCAARPPEEFHHVFELDEYEANHFAIVCDRLTFFASSIVPPPPSMESAWAAETPPMFAARPKEDVPCMSLPETDEASPTPPSRPTPPNTPAAGYADDAPSPPTPPTPAPPTEPLPPNSTEISSTPTDTVTADAAPPCKPVEHVEEPIAPTPTPAPAAERLSFADRVRSGKASEVPRNAPVRVAPPSAPEPPDAKRDTAAVKTRPTERRREAPTRRSGERGTIFYHAFVKGLPATATQSDVAKLFGDGPKVERVKLESQADKKDPTILRTFAFVLFDHEDLTSRGEPLSQIIARYKNATHQHIVSSHRVAIEEVREKYSDAPPTAKRL